MTATASPGRGSSARPPATSAAAARRVPELRRKLMDRRCEVLARVVRSEEELRELGANIEPEPEDEAQEETAGALLLRLDDRGLAAIAAIDRALARMASGTYGRCGECGRGIAVARLVALPEAATCVRCAGRSGVQRAAPVS